MASVLTTGQSIVPNLPEELPEQAENTQQQLKQNQQASVVISSEISPPELIESDKTLEFTNEKCNYSNCNLNKQSTSPEDSSTVSESSYVLQSPQAVITASKVKLENQNRPKKSQDNVQKLVEEVGSRKQRLAEKQLLSNQNKFELSLDTDNKELQKQDTFSNPEFNPDSSPTSYSQAPTPSPAENPMSQVTSVSELDDVSPTDWAYDALQSLANRHNCALAYADGTFRGKRVVNRYQFATVVDACLQNINQLIARKGANTVDEQDLIMNGTLVKLKVSGCKDLKIREIK
ncbi:MAG: hypothetical protein MJK14_12790 [Rivularia sp. ALOHA_DT_140]|nr:hypothetical protein [Rivularia sp. ALOHA_DT_140]